MTTMTLGSTRVGGRPEPPWTAAVVHTGVLAALTAGAVALWSTAALLTALLVHPVPTMTTLEREGPGGITQVIRVGSTTLIETLTMADRALR